MIKVKIETTDTKILEGKSARTNKDYKFKIQNAWVWTLDPQTKEYPSYPQKIELMLDFESEPYPVGFYELDLSSIYVNRQGRLDVSPKLAPVKVPAKPAA